MRRAPAKPVAAVAVVQRLERLTTVEAAPGSQQLSVDEKGQLLRDAAICSRMMLSLGMITRLPQSWACSTPPS